MSLNEARSALGLGPAARFVVPDPVELLAFFASEPVEESSADGYWAYEIVDARGVRLRFSFNLFERSVQTRLDIGGVEIATVGHEGALRMTLEPGRLRCELRSEGCTSTLVIEPGEALRVSWSSLLSSV